MFNKKDFIKSIINNLIDDFNRLLIVLLLFLVIITIFIRTFYLDILKFLILILLIFRITSKNSNCSHFTRRKKQSKKIRRKSKIFKN